MDNGRIIQVQPLYDDGDKWIQLAGEENITFEAIELSMPPALVESGLFGMYKDWYAGSGLVTSVHGHFIDVNPASGDMKFRALSRQRCRESCELAKELGAKRVVFHTGCAPFLTGGYIDYWAMMNAGFYKELLIEYDLTFCIENSADITPGPLRKLMDLIDDERVGVCLDLGHVNYSAVPVEQWFDTLRDRISYIHLSDNNGLFDDHIPLGTGNVDWKKADSLVRSLDRTVPVTIEMKTLGDVYTSLEYLKKNGLFI